ncbi:MAG: hypothetical protein M3N68_02145 [Actinomycetota bacterium]|nr:hypothetical protein [Actinomycetota bacterium]
MSDQSFPDEGDKTGQTDHEQHRAPGGQGREAPMAQYGADHAEYSVFDGSGNESVVAVTQNDEGTIAEGTGPTSGDALKDAARSDKLGTDFSPGVPTEQGGNA